MAATKGTRSSGSPILQIIILFLVVVLILAIRVPKVQWDRQAQHLKDCRANLENLDFGARFYRRVTGGYSSNPSEIIAFAERESLNVNPAGFKLDRLNREESGMDSFLVSYFDPYQLFSHFEELPRFEFYGRKDSLVLSIVPTERFSYLPMTRFTFKADVPITVGVDDRGEQGRFLTVGAQGIMATSQILPEPIRVRAADYIFNRHPEGIDRCPASGESYKIAVNVKMTTIAEMRAQLEKQPPEHPLSSNGHLFSILVFRMLRDADAVARRDLADKKVFETVEDSLLRIENQALLDRFAADLRRRGKERLAAAVFDSLLEVGDFENEAEYRRWEALRDSSYAFINARRESPDFVSLVEGIVNHQKGELAERYLKELIGNALREGRLLITESGTVNTTSDSIEFYSNSDLIKDRLFKAHTDSVTTRWMNNPSFAESFSRFSYAESYLVQKIDSVGVTIACPIVGIYDNQHPSLLERIFKVKGEKNHGRVENGDLSWSERR